VQVLLRITRREVKENPPHTGLMSGALKVGDLSNLVEEATGRAAEDFPGPAGGYVDLSYPVSVG
jgi:hypothetical protein